MTEHYFSLRPQSSFKVTQTLQDLVESKEDAIHWVDEPEKSDLGFLQDVGRGAYIYKLHDATYYPNSSLPPYFGKKTQIRPNKLANRLRIVPHISSLLVIEDGAIFSDSFGRNTAAPFALSLNGCFMSHFETLPKVDQKIEKPTIFVERFYEHFGHALVDMLGRFWPLALPNASLFSGMRMAGAGRNIFREGSVNDAPKFFLDLIHSLKFSEEGLSFLSEPTKFREIYVPNRITPFFGQNGPRFYDLMKVIGRNIAPEIGTTTIKNVFLSRSKIGPGKRKLASETESFVERLFAKRGFAIVHPQDLPFDDQIRLIRGATRIAGLCGSQMHLALFSETLNLQMFRIGSTTFMPTTDVSIIESKGGALHDFVAIDIEPLTEQNLLLDKTKRPWQISPLDLQRLEQELDEWLSA